MKSRSDCAPTCDGAFDPTVASTAGRLGLFMRHAAGMRTTTPARSSVSTSERSRIASFGVHRRGWKISPELDDLPQPGRAFARAVDRLEEPQEFGFRAGAGVLAQGMAEAQVAQGALRPERGGIGRHEGERAVGVLAVFGEVEMDPPDKPPAAVPVLQKGLDRQAAFQKFVVERALERAPERGETLDVEIFAPAHRRRFVDEQDQIILGRFGNARRSACRGLAAGADRRDEANGEAPPEGEVRRKTAARLGRAELQEAVPAAAVEGGRETAGDAVVERRRIRRQKLEAQRAVGRQYGDGRLGHRSGRAKGIRRPI